MKYLKKPGVVAVIIMAFSGCANLNYRSPLTDTDRLTNNKSYLYGRFSLNHDFMNKLRLALQIQNKNKSDLLSLKLVDEQEVYAIEIEPGNYQLKNFVYALFGAVMEFETSKIPLPSQPVFLSSTIIVEPNKAYYLGDYFGISRRTGLHANWSALLHPGATFYVEATFEGGILSIYQNFSKTTEELKASLPQLNNVEFMPAWGASVTPP